MIHIIYSGLDTVSLNAGNSLLAALGLGKDACTEWVRGGITIKRVDEMIPKSNVFDTLDSELIIFLSKHVSSSGVPALTVHSTGNWGTDARLGGSPNALSTAAPYAMSYILKQFSRLPLEVEKTYEATHHGPTIKAPSMFVEFGGPESVMNDKGMAKELGRIAYMCAERMKDIRSEKFRVAIGIGSNHYPEKFTKMAIEKDYAFSHMLPKHSIMNADGTDNIFMLEQATERSSEKPEIAVIDWKSLNSEVRKKTIDKLEELGMPYEKV